MPDPHHVDDPEGLTEEPLAPGEMPGLGDDPDVAGDIDDWREEEPPEESAQE